MDFHVARAPIALSADDADPVVKWIRSEFSKLDEVPRLSVPARRRIICAGATAYYLCRRDGVLSVQARRRRGRRTGAPHRA